MDFEAIITQLNEAEVGDILEFEPMYKHTTYKVGGPARAFIEVKDIPALQTIMKMIKKHHVPYYVIGRGSNVLFSDKEFDGLILSLNQYFNKIDILDHTIMAQAGASVIKMALSAANHGLSGLEFISGIPASVGGVVYMNAGAYLSDVAAVLSEVTLLNSAGEIVTYKKEEMQFSYRYSILQDHPDWVVLEAKFELTHGDKEEIKEVMKNRKAKRMATQPWDRPCAGSVFRNPDQQPAWKYIDECGLRGYSIGHARVSTKHSNFIVNSGYASAQDIKNLIEHIQSLVMERFQVELHTEVRFMNW
ncbi:UDP-N-acetylmuramate dehydrogenase [Beduini massiliensis]|uniref:UDP-N-acetylmuramate dehydrogenase n=1 Tax=Beduini massiliensis TaxID=1585974 RepID=UPI00059AA52C|nr:UDP-N-acetylmuramate dehydrogenase [Beduini massiliensis]